VVARGPGDVGCAHCTKFGATQACQVCTRLVCDACAIDWTTCSEPAGREIRLGMTARVRDVDAAGQFALVAHAIKSPRLLHLRTLTWLAECPLTRSELLVLRTIPPRLTSDGFLIRGQVSSDGESIAWGVKWQHVVDHKVVADVDIAPARATCTSAHEELFVCVSTAERVVVMKHERLDPPDSSLIVTLEQWRRGPVTVTYRQFDPLPRKVIHAVHLDRDILATGTWRVLSLDRIVGDKLEHVAQLDTGLDGNIRWIAMAGSHLVYEAAHRIEVRRLDADYQPGPVSYWRLGGVSSAALSVDGRYLALAYDKQLIVRDLEVNEDMEFSDHTDTISFMRFAHDHMLITADDDNRLILRPRSDRGYVRALIAANLPD
jgi:hypothetical protein